MNIVCALQDNLDMRNYKYIINVVEWDTG